MRRVYPERSRRGFTLIELLVSVTIIAILTAIGLVIYIEVQKGVRDSRRKQDLRSYQTALEVYYQKNGRFPCTDATADNIPTWQKSHNSDPWLEDQANCVSPSNPVISFITYLNFLPKDPTNTGSPWDVDQYSYAYWSGDVSSVNGCPKGKAQYYILVTKLERDNDPDRSAAKPYYFCDGQTELIGLPEIIPGDDIERLFFITSQD